MSRENRTDKVVFAKKGDAIAYAKKLNLVGYNLYILPEGTYKVKKYTKDKDEKAIGRITKTKDKGFIYFDYSEPITKGTRNTSYKDIDGEKLKKYIEDNDIDKKYLCNLVCRSRVYINDVIKTNRIDRLCLEKFCEFFNVKDDYFDIKEEIKEESKE